MKIIISLILRYTTSIIRLFIQRYCYKIFDDITYIRLVYFFTYYKFINLKKPKTFNEKLNWLKLYNRHDVYTTMADKYNVKKYVEAIIGSEYIVKNYGVYKNWDEINFSELPSRFVVKCTHDSGGAFVCKDKLHFDMNMVKETINRNLKKNYYWWYREWPYKNIEPQIIIDEYLENGASECLQDYKFLCFNGEPKYMYITIKGEQIYENYYDMNYNPIYIDHGFPRNCVEFNKPSNFELMKELARKLSQGVPFVRVDFFDVKGKVYFGEFTFYDFGGMRPYKGNWDEKLGELLILPNI